MIFHRQQRKNERLRVGDRLLAEKHRVVQIAVRLRFLDDDQFVLLIIEELHRFIFLQPVIQMRIGIVKT